jgi:hypothetical protein
MRRFTPKDFSWTLDGLKECIEYNKMKSKIICSTSKAAIVWVKNYDDSIALGAMSDWCISQHVESWYKYVVNDENIQIFVYDFSKFPKDHDSLIGATFKFDTKSDKEKLVCSFVRPNYPICELYKTKTDKEALYENVLRKLFGDFETNFTDFFRKANSQCYGVTEQKVEEKKSKPTKVEQPAPTPCVSSRLHNVFDEEDYDEYYNDWWDIYKIG